MKYLIIFLIFYSCINVEKKSEKINWNEYREKGYLLFEFSDSKKIKNYIQNNVFSHINNEIRITEVFNKSQDIVIYSVDIKGDLSNAEKRFYTLVKRSDNYYLIPIIYNTFYSIGNDQMIGGFLESRENEYYVVYSIQNSKLITKLDTRNENIKIGYYRDDDCLDFVPDRLQHTYNYGRINFKGIINIYCEKNHDRTSDQVAESEYVNISYSYDTIKKVWKLDNAYANK